MSVRSGAKFSMPGMMETVLNIGLNDESVQGLAEGAGDDRFAWDSYRRLLQMFGKTVLGIDGELFEERLEDAEADQGRRVRRRPRRRRPARARRRVQGRGRGAAGPDFPQDPREQLDLAVRAVFDSWNTDRAVLYRRQERIPDDLGTAVNVQAMVFGNLGDDSGTGVAFTRDPATGQPGRLRRLPGRTPRARTSSRASATPCRWPTWSGSTRCRTTSCWPSWPRSKAHYRDLCDIEFTIERGKLWMLQTRVGKRTAAAAFRIAASWSTRASSTRTRRSRGSPATQLAG